MAKNKTFETGNSVSDFINAVPDELKRNDSFKLIELIKSQTGLDPKIWGGSIIGFGSYHYKYDTGHEGDAPLVGFSPRKDAFSLYLASDFDNKEKLLEKFGKYEAGKGCIYIKKLQDVDTEVFQKMVDLSIKHLKDRYPG